MIHSTCTFHWTRLVMWPCLTSKTMRQLIPTKCLECELRIFENILNDHHISLLLPILKLFHQIPMIPALTREAPVHFLSQTLVTFYYCAPAASPTLRRCYHLCYFPTGLTKWLHLNQWMNILPEASNNLIESELLHTEEGNLIIAFSFYFHRYMVKKCLILPFDIIPLWNAVVLPSLPCTVVERPQKTYRSLLPINCWSKVTENCEPKTSIYSFSDLLP